MLHRYGIEVAPVQSDRPPVGKKLKRIIELLIEEHFKSEALATDYKANIVCRVPLSIATDPYVVRYRSEDEDEPSANANTYRLRLQETGTVMVSELIDHLTSTQASSLFASKDGTIQALNIVLGHHPKTVRDIVSLGNKHFEISETTRQTMPLGAGLQAMRGFFVSVRAATARVLVNVQIKHGAFYMEGPLDNLMDVYDAQSGRDSFRLARFLLRVRVPESKGHKVEHAYFFDSCLRYAGRELRSSDLRIADRHPNALRLIPYTHSQPPASCTAAKTYR